MGARRDGWGIAKQIGGNSPHFRPAEFEERGAHELKGVPGEWRLFAVASPSSGGFRRKLNSPVVSACVACRQRLREEHLSEQLGEDLSRVLVFDRRRGLDLHKLRPLRDELQHLLRV